MRKTFSVLILDWQRHRRWNEFLESQRKLMVTGSHFVVADQEGSLSVQLGIMHHPAAMGYLVPLTVGTFWRVLILKPFWTVRSTVAFGLNSMTMGTRSSGMPGSENCTVDYDRFPGLINPENGFLVSANNDPSGLSFDGSIANDETYVGGPWDIGFRADRIDARSGAH